MADLAALKRRRTAAQIALAKAEKAHRGVTRARALFTRATAALLRAQLDHRTAAPLLRNKRPAGMPDLFAGAP